MTHHCPVCGFSLRAIVAQGNGIPHFVCVPCARVCVCFSDCVRDCETPVLCAPFPWRFSNPQEALECRVQSGPHSRGLL